MFRRRQKSAPETQSAPSSGEKKEFKPFRPDEWLTIKEAFSSGLGVVRNAPSEMGLAALAENPNETRLPGILANAMNMDELPRVVPVVSFRSKDVVILLSGVVPPEILRVHVGRDETGKATSVNLRVDTEALGEMSAQENPTFTAITMSIPRSFREVSAPQSESYAQLQELYSYIPETMRPDLRPGKPV